MTNPAVPPATPAPQCPTWCTTKHKPTDYQPDEYGQWGVIHDSAPVTVRTTNAELRDESVDVQVTLMSYDCESPEDVLQPRTLLALDGTDEADNALRLADAWLDADQSERVGYALIRRAAQLRAGGTPPANAPLPAPGCPAWCDDHTDADGSDPAEHAHSVGVVPAHWSMGDVAGLEVTLTQSGDGPPAVEVFSVHELDAVGCRQTADILTRMAAMIEGSHGLTPHERGEA